MDTRVKQQTSQQAGLPVVTISVFRFDPNEEQAPHFDDFEVSVRPGQTVLEALFDILDMQDGSLAFRYSCRGAVCGSCAMYINGAYRLACETQVMALNARRVTVNPLPHLPVIRDLVVDMAPFFEKYEQIKPYLLTDSVPQEKEKLQSPKQRRAINEAIDCILCAACYAACPMVWTDKGYLGPAALTKAYRFVADSRDEARSSRLRLVANEDGVWRCHTIMNCVEACPKKINQTDAIQHLKRGSVLRKLKFW
ncbi:MAG: succinate dehydrogenase iron-sulfur subunit [Chloroflexi bacterium]|nr:succinate dehydrogenase iron-sulfur subunit [Chloroflexota bacterium]